MKSRKWFGVLNIVDLILILLVIVAGIVGVRLMGSGSTAEETTGRTYTYVVMGQEVLTETAECPVIGENVYNSSTSAYLGTVAEVRTEPFTETIFDRSSSSYKKAEVPHYCDIYLTIEGQGTETEKDITVEGTTVKVGMELNVKGKGYAFKGIVVEVRDGE